MACFWPLEMGICGVKTIKYGTVRLNPQIRVQEQIEIKLGVSLRTRLFYKFLSEDRHRKYVSCVVSGPGTPDM